MAGGKIYAPAPKRGLNRKQTKQVQKIIERNKMLKHSYVSLADGSILSATTGFYELTVLAKGDEVDQRDSDRINLQRIKLSLLVRRNQDNSASDVAPFRVLVVRSKEGPKLVTDLPINMTNAPDFDEFQILHDQVYALGANDADTGLVDMTSRVINLKFKFKNKKVPHMVVGYDEDDSATLAQTNPIYLVIFNENDTGAGIATTGFSHLTWFDRD